MNGERRAEPHPRSEGDAIRIPGCTRRGRASRSPSWRGEAGPDRSRPPRGPRRGPRWGRCPLALHPDRGITSPRRGRRPSRPWRRALHPAEARAPRPRGRDGASKVRAARDTQRDPGLEGGRARFGCATSFGCGVSDSSDLRSARPAWAARPKLSAEGPAQRTTPPMPGPRSIPRAQAVNGPDPAAVAADTEAEGPPTPPVGNRPPRGSSIVPTRKVVPRPRHTSVARAGYSHHRVGGHRVSHYVALEEELTRWGAGGLPRRLSAAVLDQLRFLRSAPMGRGVRGRPPTGSPWGAAFRLN